MPINFDSMDYFIALARERSFTRAAEALHITQQSLSSHIAGIEKELGCPLVVRRVPLELTCAGRTFLRYAEDIHRTRCAMQRVLSDIAENQAGELRVGIAHVRGRAIMPRVLSAFGQHYPNITVILTEDSNDGLHKLLHDGRIDLAIAEFSQPAPELELLDFYHERVVLCLSDALLAQHPLDLPSAGAALRRGDLRPLRGMSFVLASKSNIGGRIGRELLRRAGLQPQVRVQSRNVETLLALCLEGAGACFYPETLIYSVLSSEQLAQLHICALSEDAAYPIHFACLRRAYPRSALDAFIRIARQAVQ